MTVTTALSATFNPSTVSSQELATVKNASSRDQIGSVVTRILDKVSDWFCGTRRAEVKKHLFDMYSPASTDQVKITAFLALQAMAGEGHKDRFQSSREDGQERYTLQLDSAMPEDSFCLSREIIYCDKGRVLAELRANREDEALQPQLEKDIGRGSYLVNGCALEGSKETRLAQLEDALNAMHCTPQERKAIVELSNQSIFGIIMEASLPLDSAGRVSGALGLCPSPGESKVEFRISREDGVIRVHALSYKDVATMQDEGDRNSMLETVQSSPLMQKSSEISIDVAVSAQGHMNVLALDFLANNGDMTE